MKHIVQTVRPVSERIDDMGLSRYHDTMFIHIPLGEPDDYMVAVQESVDDPIKDLFLTVTGIVFHEIDQRHVHRA